jgi:hypothetical protein
MPIQLSGSLVITGSITTTGVITMSGSIASATSASYSSTSDLLQGTGSVGFATTASLLTVSSSQQQISASQQQISSSLLRISSSYASTGSNTFTGIQNFSNTCTPNSFTAGASIYTAGGLQVTQDTYFSSSVYIKGNVTVYGTQSVSYVSSSQFNIGTNIITVNTFTPSVRYGGLSVFDSGSTGLTGSIFWDSELNRWIYVNASGSGGGATYGGGMFISGPRNSQGIGCEQGTTACMLMVGQGGDHMTSSQVYHDTTVTCVGTGASITSAGAACFASSVTAGGRVHGTTTGLNSDFSSGGLIAYSCGSTLKYTQIGFDCIGNYGWIQPLHQGTSYTNLVLNGAGGNVGIGTNAPTRLLDVSNTSGDSTIVITSADATGQSSLFYGKPSDANIGGVLYNHCNNQMSFRVNDATRMSITSCGNVGIGTCTPSTLLQTNQTGTTGYFYSGQQNGTEIAYWYYNANQVEFSSKSATRALVFLTNDTPRMTITCTGVLNLSGPSQKIYSNNETTSYAYLQLDNTGGSLTMGIERSTGGGLANCTSVYSGYIGTNNATALSFGTNVTERMRITSTGTVEMNACDATYINFKYAGTSKGFIGVAGATTDIISGAAAGDMTIRAQQKMQFATGGDTPRMTITCGGSVSIGSTSAAYNFNVYGASGADGWGAFFGGGGATKGGIYIGNAGNQYGTLYFDNGNNNVYLKQSYVSGCVIVIANTGGVYLANGGTSWAAISSDVRKKKNFETTQGLAEVLQIEPIKYHFNEDDNNSIKRIGFKAQNIKPLIPEMVLETGEFAEDGSPYLTITSDYILPVLVKAIQEQQCTINTLKTCLGIN